LKRIVAILALATVLAAGSGSVDAGGTKTAVNKAAPPKNTIPDPAQLTVAESEIATDADFSWSVTLEIRNLGDSGLYLDSLFCLVEDLDPGETRLPRSHTLDLRYLTKLTPSLSAGDGNVIQHTGPAMAEHARLTYTMYCHRSAGGPFPLTIGVEAKPGGSAAYPSKLLEVGGRKVETVLVPALRDTGRGPGILMIHGHGTHARHSIRTARLFAIRGYTVMLVSMPGYGQSTGPADFMGPATLSAAEAALAEFRTSSFVNPKRIVVWGVSRGATVAAEMAERSTDLRGAVLQSGIYDLWATYRGTKLPGFREAIVAEVGADSAAWSARSPLLRAKQVKMPVLVLHGDRDENVPVGQARAMVAAVRAAGASVDTVFVGNATHVLGINTVHRAAFDFFGRTLAP
jgi:pimeloyl-ACP methyl ester carboxylesterase